ncbi:HEAT repeat domain-containing protein [Alkalihalobacillus sp. LMS39]|uniref:HEAT repeat domain-containing protein n=1 Tax=Alkalihalobacillus sp. LMS39 TaxID=2924032 RepID=UPI001FB4B948|nr:HEAT repeat domain-containing protein [Alkalihalobacillus sp. LMS39]UOE95279.1 HEAT repeat domain-containing protein [Alkalihalobacillus sp. LMS39]
MSKEDLDTTMNNLKNPQKEVALKAIKSISSKKENALPTLRHTLQSSEDEDLVTMALVTLGEIGRIAKPAIPEVHVKLAHPNSQIRMAAALFFVRLGKASIQPLKDSLQNSSNLNEQFWACWALAMIDSKKVNQKGQSILIEVEAKTDDLIEKAAAQEALAKIIGLELHE